MAWYMMLSGGRRPLSFCSETDDMGCAVNIPCGIVIGLVGRATADENACQTVLRKTVLLKPTTATASSPAVGKKKEGGFDGFLKGLGTRLVQTLGTKK